MSNEKENQTLQNFDENYRRYHGQSEFFKVIELQEIRWNEFCQQYESWEDNWEENYIYEIVSEKYFLYCDGLLVGAFKNNVLYVYTPDFLKQINKDILYYEERNEVIITEFISEEVFAKMNDFQLLERIENLLLSSTTSKDDDFCLFYGLAQKAKEEVMKRLNTTNKGGNQND